MAKTDAMKESDKLIESIIFLLNKAMLSDDIDERYDAVEEAEADMQKLFDACVKEEEEDCSKYDPMDFSNLVGR
jgi:uncharacterized protein YqeY